MLRVQRGGKAPRVRTLEGLTGGAQDRFPWLKDRIESLEPTEVIKWGAGRSSVGQQLSIENSSPTTTPGNTYWHVCFAWICDSTRSFGTRAGNVLDIVCVVAEVKGTPIRTQGPALPRSSGLSARKPSSYTVDSLQWPSITEKTHGGIHRPTSRRSPASCTRPIVPQTRSDLRTSSGCGRRHETS